jgi:NitT/TauT family transport system substrate-binding protein
MFRFLARLAGAVAMLCAAAAAQAETITVTHYGSAFYGAPYAVAMQKGFFKAHGIDITGILTSAGGGTSVRNMLASDLPFGEVALSAAVAAINHGQPPKIIFGGVDTVDEILWIAKKGSPIHSFDDLKGKRVAFTSPGSATNMIILMALKAKGWPQSAMQLVPAGDIGANLSAVLTGAVDSAMTGEPVWSENQDKVQAAFWVHDVLNPRMMQSCGVTTDAYLASPEGQKKLAAIYQGRREGVDFIYAHPDEAADITAKAYNGDAALYRRVFKHMIDIHYWTPGIFDKEGQDRMVEGLQIMGQQKGPVDWGKITDTRFVDAKKN